MAVPHSFIGTRTRGGIQGHKPSPDELPGADWKQISDLRHSIVESLKEDLYSIFDGLCAQRNVSRSTIQLVKVPQTMKTPGTRLKRTRKVRSPRNSPPSEKLQPALTPIPETSSPVNKPSMVQIEDRHDSINERTVSKRPSIKQTENRVSVKKCTIDLSIDKKPVENKGQRIPNNMPPIDQRISDGQTTAVDQCTSQGSRDSVDYHSCKEASPIPDHAKPPSPLTPPILSPPPHQPLCPHDSLPCPHETPPQPTPPCGPQPPPPNPSSPQLFSSGNEIGRKRPRVPSPPPTTSPAMAEDHTHNDCDMPTKLDVIAEETDDVFLTPPPKIKTPAQKPLNVLQQHSFLPAKNSPMRIAEAQQEKQKILKAKIAEKNEKEEARKRRLEQKKEQDRLDRIKKREEKMKRVAENQALLEKKHLEKSKKIQGESQQTTQKQKELEARKAKQREEREQRIKERQAAAEQRRKEKEKQDRQKQLQVEDERRLLDKIYQKRMEAEEEERRKKREEKAEKERLKELKQKKVPQVKEPPSAIIKTKEEKHPVPVKPEPSKPKQTNVTNMLKEWASVLKKINPPPEEQSTTPETSTTSAVTSNNTTIAAPSPNVITATDTIVTDASALNSTYVVEPLEAVSGPPTMATPAVQRTQPTSYEITPANKDPLVASDNYDIHNLNSEDESEDEDCPSKPVPQWAAHNNIKQVMKEQEYFVNHGLLDVEKIFSPEELLLEPELANIFGHVKRRFFKRTSSACWTSPMLKKSKKANK